MDNSTEVRNEIVKINKNRTPPSKSKPLKNDEGISFSWNLIPFLFSYVPHLDCPPPSTPKNQPLPQIQTAKNDQSDLIAGWSGLFSYQTVRLNKLIEPTLDGQDSNKNLHKTRKLSENPAKIRPYNTPLDPLGSQEGIIRSIRQRVSPDEWPAWNIIVYRHT
jgi:hypothetical protein